MSARQEVVEIRLFLIILGDSVHGMRPPAVSVFFGCWEVHHSAVVVP
jgi:hypothetical protein